MEEPTPSDESLKVGDPPKEEWEGGENPERREPEQDPESTEEPADQN